MQTEMRDKQANTANPLKGLFNYGQSVWLDYIRRNLITSGDLQRMIKEDGLRGVTSNPAIFEKAIAGSSDYKQDLEELSQDTTLSAKSVYERIAVKDIQLTAEVLEPIFKESQRRDGYVSLEVSPDLSHDTQGTCEEARRLWKMVARQNVMIKVPATEEGIVAIEKLISEGININVTLIFSLEYYEQVVQAYIKGLEKLEENGGDVSKIASVASFFISRIDTAIESIITEKASGQSDTDRQKLMNLSGKVAIANAKIAYKRYEELFSGTNWQKLRDKGAQTQRVLWASTGTKSPKFSDVLYIETLIGQDTVNTIPPATYDAFRDHGQLAGTLKDDIDLAQATLDDLNTWGISFKVVTDKLLTDGLKMFEDAFENLLCAVEIVLGESNELHKKQRYSLSEPLMRKVNTVLEDWESNKKANQIWHRDTSLWTNQDENQWLGWLGISDAQMEQLDDFREISDRVIKEGYTHILLLGMGGSSLGPEVMSVTFGRMDGYPEMHVLDSTDPAQIKSFEEKVDLAKTLFIVSSKSGGTLETNIFKQYFFERVKEVVGAENAGKQFIAITDPNSHLQVVAEEHKFSRIYFGDPTIGGRFSVLSDFGMIPAAASGIDVSKFLDQTGQMVHACAGCVPTEENPGVVLGAILGVLGNEGINKITITASPQINNFGAWLEQLLAESTGKEGKGLIPVDHEELGSPEVYGQDRLFIYIRYQPMPAANHDEAIDQLEKAGHPVVRIEIADTYDIGQEFFRWEMATAVAGSIMKIHPFNQPDVEASKIVTKELTQEYEAKGHLPEEEPFFEEDGIKLFGDEKNSSQLNASVGEEKTLLSYLKAHLDRIKVGDYVALLGYIEMNNEHVELLQTIRHLIRDRKKVATCLGFGPRFLHSTGQAYKGGPNTGVFLQITCDDLLDIKVPQQKYTFGVVKAAQARGDFQVLSDRNRRTLRIHLGQDTKSHLQKLTKIIKESLS